MEAHPIISEKGQEKNSSPEHSPRIEMDTSVEKSDNQQFCLRWNNHQVRRSIIDSIMTRFSKRNYFHPLQSFCVSPLFIFILFRRLQIALLPT